MGCKKTPFVGHTDHKLSVKMTVTVKQMKTKARAGCEGNACLKSDRASAGQPLPGEGLAVRGVGCATRNTRACGARGVGTPEGPRARV